MKRIITIILLFMISAESAAENLKVVYLNEPCKKMEWKAEYTVNTEGEKRTDRLKVYYKEGVYRIEIQKPPYDITQVILREPGETVILNPEIEKAFIYRKNDPVSELFLQEIFPNIGSSRKNKKLLDVEMVSGEPCRVNYYEILKPYKGVMVKTLVREYNHLKNDFTMKIECISHMPVFTGKNKAKAVKVTEIYTVLKKKCKWFLSDKKFTIPADYDIEDMTGNYIQKVKSKK